MPRRGLRAGNDGVQQKTLSNRTVAALQVARDTVFWDRELTGFGVCV